MQVQRGSASGSYSEQKQVKNGDKEGFGEGGKRRGLGFGVRKRLREREWRGVSVIA